MSNKTRRQFGASVAMLATGGLVGAGITATSQPTKAQTDVAFQVADLNYEKNTSEEINDISLEATADVEWAAENFNPASYSLWLEVKPEGGEWDHIEYVLEKDNVTSENTAEKTLHGSIPEADGFTLEQFQVGENAEETTQTVHARLRFELRNESEVVETAIETTEIEVNVQNPQQSADVTVQGNGEVIVTE